MIHKKEEGTYHLIEKLRKEMPGSISLGRGFPLLLIPEYSGINKEQRIPDRSKTAHRKPPVKCFLTLDVQPLLFTLDEFSPPDLERGVSPLGPPVPSQPLLFTLETNREHSVIFEIAPKYCILDSFVDYCQEAFNKRLPVCCFGSVRNSLFLINS